MNDDMDPAKVRAASRKAKSRQNEEKEEENEDSPISTFSIDCKDTRGKVYAGQFTFRVPALGDQIKIAQMKAHYLPNGAAADPNGLMLAEMISYLEITLTEKPSWWAPHLFYDATAVNEVYGRCLAYADRFLGKNQVGRDDHDGSGDEEEDDESADHSDHGDVGGGVRASSKRREVLSANRT